MTNMTVPDFIKCTTDWAALRNAQFKFNWPVKGGWEGWIQVDLTAFILSVDDKVEILREQPVYRNNRRRCDLLLNADSMPTAQIPIEIKAQSFNNHDTFIDGVIDDIDKFDERNRTYRSSTCIVLGMPFNPPTLDELLGIEVDDHPIFQQIFVGEVAGAVAVWTAAQGWLDPDGAAPTRVEGTVTQPAPPGRGAGRS